MEQAPTSKYPSYWPWLVWILGALFYFYEYFLQVSPGVMVPELMRAFKVNAGSLGNLAAFYFYSYAIMQIPVGVLLDRYGPRLLLTAATFTCMLGCFLFGSALSLSTAEIGRCLMGLGAAFAIVGAFKLAANWFAMDRFAMLVGLTVMIGMSGALTGEMPLAMLVDHISWRPSMLFLGILGGGLSFLIWTIVRDYPNKQKIDYQAAISKNENVLTGLKYVLRSKQCWFAAIYGGLMFAPTSIFGSLWGVPFLMQAYHISRPVAAGAISMMFIGWAVGSPLTGLVSDYLGRRKPLMWLGSSGALVSIMCIIYGSGSTLWVLYFLLFIFGFFSSGFLPSYSIIREISPDYANATALGYMNTLNMVGGAIGQPLIGLILDLCWNGEMDNSARVYSIANYHTALIVIPLCIIGSLVTLFYIRETYCGKKVSLESIVNPSVNFTDSTMKNTIENPINSITT